MRTDAERERLIRETLDQASALVVDYWMRAFYAATGRILSLTAFLPEDRKPAEPEWHVQRLIYRPPRTAILLFRNPHYIRLPISFKRGIFSLGAPESAVPYLLPPEVAPCPPQYIVTIEANGKSFCVVCEDLFLVSQNREATQ